MVRPERMLREMASHSHKFRIEFREGGFVGAAAIPELPMTSDRFV